MRRPGRPGVARRRTAEPTRLRASDRPTRAAGIAGGASLSSTAPASRASRATHGEEATPPGAKAPRSRSALTAPLLLIAAAVFFQSGAALATRVIAAVGIVDALWLRTAIAAVILMAISPRSLRFPPAGSRLALALLTLVLLAMNLSFYGAISRAPLGIVVTVEFLGPLAVAIIGARRRLDFVWIGLALAGVVLLAGPTSSVSALGLALAFAAACAWGAYVVLAKHVVARMEPLRVTTLMFTGSAVLLTPAFVVLSPRLVHHPTAIGLGAAVAVLSSALPYLLKLFALRLISASTYGVIISLEPAIAALMGFVISAQALSLPEIVAVFVVMIAAAGASWTSKPGQRPSGLEVG